MNQNEATPRPYHPAPATIQDVVAYQECLTEYATASTLLDATPETPEGQEVYDLTDAALIAAGVALAAVIDAYVAVRVAEALRGQLRKEP